MTNGKAMRSARFAQNPAEPPLRACAVRAMRHTRADEALAVLAGLVEHERTELDVLAAAIEALGAAGDESAILALRTLMGSTDPDKAKDGTIRKDFGASVENNAIHGSDGADTARIEIGYFFSGIEFARLE